MWSRPIEGTLPVLTFAHIAAVRGTLPAGFDQWWLRTSQGHTVAHYAAVNGHIPDGFDEWDLVDGEGVTVAHAAAYERKLPAWFSRWDVRDATGSTVAHISALRGGLPRDVPEDVWMLRDAKGRTVYHVAAGEGRLPEGFDKWDLTDDEGWTVAHMAACNGTLPPDVPDWALRMPRVDHASPGTTVAAYAAGIVTSDRPPNDPRTIERACAVYAEMECEILFEAETPRTSSRDVPPARPISGPEFPRGA
jgi:hypothetical protein